MSHFYKNKHSLFKIFKSNTLEWNGGHSLPKEIQFASWVAVLQKDKDPTEPRFQERRGQTLSWWQWLSEQPGGRTTNSFCIVVIWTLSKGPEN